MKGLRTAIVALGLSLGVSGLCRAAGPVIPDFWKSGERLTKPDLSSLQRLRFLTTVDFPPFSFVDPAGNLTGFHIDLARAICAELGVLDKCQIQALPWDDLGGALAKKEGEAIIAGIAVTAKSRRQYTFSRPYMRFPARFVVQKTTNLAEPLYKSISGLKVGVIGGSAHERMLRDFFPDVRVAVFTDAGSLHDALRKGQVEAIFGDGMRLSFWLGGKDSAGCCRFAGGPYLSSHYLGEGLAIATRPDETALTAAFNYALKQINDDGKFAELYLRYFPVSFY